MTDISIRDNSALDCFKDLRKLEHCSYRRTLQELFSLFGFNYSFANEEDAKAIFIAMVYDEYGRDSVSTYYALISMGLMNGYTKERNLTQRRTKYGKTIGASADTIRKKEDIIFKNIIQKIGQDLVIRGDINQYVKEMRKIATQNKVLKITDGDYYEVFLPNLK